MVVVAVAVAVVVWFLCVCIVYSSRLKRYTMLYTMLITLSIKQDAMYME